MDEVPSPTEDFPVGAGKEEARAIHVIKKQHHQHHPIERKYCSVSPYGVAVFSSNIHQQWDLGSLSVF